jgi:hypothetical protein
VKGAKPAVARLVACSAKRSDPDPMIMAYKGTKLVVGAPCMIQTHGAFAVFRVVAYVSYVEVLI